MRRLLFLCSNESQSSCKKRCKKGVYTERVCIIPHFQQLGLPWHHRLKQFPLLSFENVGTTCSKASGSDLLTFGYQAKYFTAVLLCDVQITLSCHRCHKQMGRIFSTSGLSLVITFEAHISMCVVKKAFFFSLSISLNVLGACALDSFALGAAPPQTCHSSLPLPHAAISASLPGQLYRNSHVQGEALLNSCRASCNLFNSLQVIGVLGYKRAV